MTVDEAKNMYVEKLNEANDLEKLIDLYLPDSPERFNLNFKYNSVQLFLTGVEVGKILGKSEG